VVLQADTHGRGIDDHRDVVRAQLVGRADSRQHQQLRRLHRPAGDDDLTGRAGFARRPVTDVANPRRPFAVEEQLADVRVGLHGDVGALHDRPEVGIGNGPASPRSLGHLIVTHAVLVGAVEILVAGQPKRDRRLQPRPAQRVLIALILHPQRPPGAVIGRIASLLVLGSEEVGQHLDVAPARTAVGVAPSVVVDPVAANVDHAVDRRAAPERAPAGPGNNPLGSVPLGDGPIIPRQRTAPQRGSGGGHRDLGDVIGRSGFKHQDAGGRVLTQASRDHAPRAAGADDDIVVHEHLQVSLPSCSVSRRPCISRSSCRARSLPIRAPMSKAQRQRAGDLTLRSPWQRWTHEHPKVLHGVAVQQLA
jgi:hypothetical protein